MSENLVRHGGALEASDDMQWVPGDTIFAYGRSNNLAELEERQAGGVGDKAHESAVVTQQSVQTEEAS